MISIHLREILDHTVRTLEVRRALKPETREDIGRALLYCIDLTPTPVLPPSRVDTMALDEAGPGPILLKGLTRTSYLVYGVRLGMMVCSMFSSLRSEMCEKMTLVPHLWSYLPNCLF